MGHREPGCVRGQSGALVAKHQGDVLITGDVANAGKGVRLRILPGERSAEVEPRTSEGRRAGEYALTDTGLPLDFDRDFEAVLVALVAASVAPATEREGHYLVDVLTPAAGRLKHLCARMPADMNEEGRASLWYALGLAAHVLGEQTGQNAWLTEAVAAYRAALEATAREQIPLRWAVIQKDLGAALARRGEREDGTESLEQAVGAFRAALKVFSPEQNPWQWAMTQNNLGNALLRLGEREDGTRRLQEAAEAFDAALKVFTRERYPLDRARTQSNLANVLCTLGQRENASLPLRRAIELCRAALRIEGVRELRPLQWAGTQNNLGNPLLALGQREGDIELLRQAAEAFRAALKVRTRDRLPWQ